VPEIIVADDPKAAVPLVLPAGHYNLTYQELACHYGTVVIPARHRKPRDKVALTYDFAHVYVTIIDSI
ncbi:MAG: hypothetical protein H5T99_06800, partial [Moorella sp. (in: Bacteria)]|nr:hypothetical protein [Moorella sp. (in: firmicutes)]